MDNSFEQIESEFVDNENDVFIFVVDQSFSVKRGCQYFKKYENSDNFINTNIKAQKHKSKILSWIFKKLPSMAKQIERLFDISNERTLSITDIVISIATVFFAEEHIAADPKALDPIIFQEGAVAKTQFSEIISLYNGCPRHPVIIIILKDDNIDRVDDILSQCPDGLAFKIIRNNTNESIIKYIINKGAEDVNGFLNDYIAQSFYTCSNTKREVLIGNTWSNNSLINDYSPTFLKIRSDLICDNKLYVSKEISDVIDSLEDLKVNSYVDEKVRDVMIGIARLYRVFALDNAGDDIKKVLQLSKKIDSEVLKAIAGKYCYLLNYGIEEQKRILNESYNVLKSHMMLDNAVYCKNNSLALSFESERIDVEGFRDLIGEAVAGVPGLVGISHIYNNLGLAEFMTGDIDAAENAFVHALEYAKRPDRKVQRYGIEINQMIMKSYYRDKIHENDIIKIFKQVIDGMCKRDVLPFISSRYVLNILIIAYKRDKELFESLCDTYPECEEYIMNGYKSNVIGQTQIALQLNYLKKDFPKAFKSIELAKFVNNKNGCRNDFICREGLNPFYFCVWL